MGYKASTAAPLAVSAADAAAMLDVSVAYVWDLVKRGILPHCREGKLMRIRVADIQAFLDERLSTEYQALEYKRAGTAAV
jgi:excisionase family DNA binding protein